MPEQETPKFSLWGVTAGNSKERVLSAEVLTGKGDFHRVAIQIQGGNLIVETLEKGGKRKTHQVAIPDW